MASVKFYQYKETNGKTLILITFTFNHERLRLSTGLSCPVKAWDQEDQKVKPVKEFAETNKRLREITKFLLDKYDELFLSESAFTKDEIKKKAIELKESYQVFSGRRDQQQHVQTTLFSLIDIFRQRYKNKITPLHLGQYNALKNHLERFQKEKKFIVEFDTIGKDFYIQFTDYMKESGFKANTVGSQIKKIKRLMNEAIEDKLTTNQDHRKRDFKILSAEVDTVYLNEKEIMALYELPIENEQTRRLRDIFVLNCYTGLRFSDWSKVCLENIHDGNLYVRTQKTDEPVIIPVKPLVSEILARYDQIRIPSLVHINDALKVVGEKAHEKKIGNGNQKKWLEIRSHTARRSFATNAYLAGIPMRDIMQITGHRSTVSFLRYIRVTKLETAQKLKDHPFFS